MAQTKRGKIIKKDGKGVERIDGYKYDTGLFIRRGKHEHRGSKLTNKFNHSEITHTLIIFLLYLPVSYLHFP